MSPFVSISNEEPFIGKYLGFKTVPNRFDVEKQTVRYLFELPDGTQKPWENGQIPVANTFDAIEKGSWVKIIRSGEAAQTRYDIKIVADKTGAVTVKEAKDISKEMAG